MYSDINQIDIKDYFWARINQVISFGLKASELPKDIHFSFSFDSRSPCANFHITKNVSNNKDKPKIEICRIDKRLLKVILPYLFFSIQTELIDIDKLKATYGFDLKFISLENIKGSPLEKYINDKFNSISTLKRNRLNIEGNLKDIIDEFVTSPDNQQLVLNTIADFPKEYHTTFDGGFILYGENIIGAFRLNRTWFKYRTEFETLELLSTFLKPAIAKSIIWKTHRALKAINRANKYSDTEYLNKPIKLVKASFNFNNMS